MEKYFSINRNGLSIRCKIYCKNIRSIDSVVIFGHGFSGHKDNRAAMKMANRMEKRHGDTALVIFDLPCHGEDGKNRIRLNDCMEYIGNVIDYVRETYETEKIYACATSFGGYLFLKYIYDKGNPFLKIALRCPAINMYEILSGKIMSDHDLRELQKGKYILIGFDRKVKITDSFLQNLKDNDIAHNDYSLYSKDISIVQGTDDEIVSFGVVESFSQKNGITMYPVDKADHRFTDPQKMDKAISVMIDFLFS